MTRLAWDSGWCPPGEVGIIVAGSGATAGVVDGELFAVSVGMFIVTTLAFSPLPRRALQHPASPSEQDDQQDDRRE